MKPDFIRIILTLCVATVMQAQVTVTGLQQLGTLGGDTSYATGINASGQVVGYSQTAGNAAQHAFIYSGGIMTDLGTLGGTNSAAYGINSSGQVTGDANIPGDTANNVFLHTTSMTDLGVLSGSFGQGRAINISGQIAGTSGTAFRYSSGSMVSLGTLGGASSTGEAINAAGQVAGTSDTAGGARAFLWTSGIMTDLGTLGGAYSYGYGLNDVGQVVGYSATSGGLSHAFLYDGGMTDLGTLGGSDSSATSINSLGQVAGYANITGNTDVHLFFYTDGTMYDLNTLAASFMSSGGSPGFTYLDPYSRFALNDAGQLVGSGTYFDGVNYNNRAFLMTISAIPEPSTYAVAAGLAALGLAVWRRREKRRISAANSGAGKL